MHTLPGILADMQQRLREDKSAAAAWAIIEEYFACNGPEGIRTELWTLTKGAITNDLMDEAETGAKRHELLFGYEFLQLMIDAVEVLNYQRIQQNLPKTA